MSYIYARNNVKTLSNRAICNILHDYKPRKVHATKAIVELYYTALSQAILNAVASRIGTIIKTQYVESNTRGWYRIKYPNGDIIYNYNNPIKNYCMPIMGYSNLNYVCGMEVARPQQIFYANFGRRSISFTKGFSYIACKYVICDYVYLNKQTKVTGITTFDHMHTNYTIKYVLNEYKKYGYLPLTAIVY